MPPLPDAARFEAIVIGTGFAGAVTACRLAQAEMRICVLERGRRYDADDLPVYPKEFVAGVASTGDGGSMPLPDFSRLLWTLKQGLWDLRDLGDIVVAQAAGYGGGSLIYANVHLRPPRELFDDSWPKSYRGDGLDSYFDLVAQQLGAQLMPEPPEDQSDVAKTVRMQRAAERLGLEYFRAPLAIDFQRCDLRGDCCFGCKTQAKNTLDRNYLAKAESETNANGRLVDVLTLAEVTSISRPDNGGDFTVEYRYHGEGPRHQTLSVVAPVVFLCAGAVNTTELLLRSRQLGKLKFTGAGLGSRYFSNADALATVVDCAEQHEADRGPTITSAIAWHRKPDDADPSARWIVPFTLGRLEPPIGSRIGGRGWSAEVACPCSIDQGSWRVGDAGGALIVRFLDGAPGTGSEIEWHEHGRDPERIATCAGRPRKASHWLMFQDGGMPSELEPLLGVFASPLWLRRNRYRESLERGPAEADAARVRHRAPSSRRPALARLPVANVPDLVTSLSRGGFDARPSLTGQISGLSARQLDASWLWHRLPRQFRAALEEWQQQLLDTVAEGVEPIVAQFLAEAGDRVERDLDVEPLLRKFPMSGSFGSFDPSAIHRVQIAQRALRMGVQFVWGSQVEMIRHGVTKFLAESIFGERGGLIERITELLRWALDYRVGDGHTAMILAMGRDTLPGKLSLDAWDEPSPGSHVLGQETGASRVLVSAQLERGTWSAGDAIGELVVIKSGGELRVGETLLIGGREIGVVGGETEIKARIGRERKRAVGEPEGTGSPSAEEKEAEEKEVAGLRALRFTQRAGRNGDVRQLPRPPLRADLPSPLAATEWATQELLLRDLAAAWQGELRTDPMWSFLRRRVTVHSQGGCPMADSEAAGFTDENGKVFGCKGLYVMDGAAFPASVGVDPSATIAAVAERKIEQFLVEQGKSKSIAALKKEREAAVEWMDGQVKLAGVEVRRRETLDPLNCGQSAAAQARRAGASPRPAHRPIGIKFYERMSGQAFQPGRENAPIRVAMGLAIRIDDLWSFLERDRLRRPEPLQVFAGLVTLQSDSPELPTRLNVRRDQPRQSYLRLRRDPVVGGRERRTLEYELELEDLGAGARAAGRARPRYTLRGDKIIRDDPSFDVLADTTTLFFEVFDDAGRPVLANGEARLAAADFLRRQLPNTVAPGTDDKCRQAWALTAFARFFFGHVVDVYAPELDEVADIAKKIMNSTHV